MDFNNAFGRRVKNSLAWKLLGSAATRQQVERSFFAPLQLPFRDWLPGAASSFIPFVSDPNGRSVCATVSLSLVSFSSSVTMSAASPPITLLFFFPALEELHAAPLTITDL